MSSAVSGLRSQCTQRPVRQNSQLIAALKQIIDLVSPGYAATRTSSVLPVRPFRRDVCDIVELRNDELPEEGWE